MSVRYIVATEYLLDHLVNGDTSFPSVPLSELAVSGVTFETILASVELDETISPADRGKWRTNLANFRKLLTQSGGEVPGVSTETLERWGKVLLLDLTHDYGDGPEEMSVEERLVIATAADLGLIYLTPVRDWNDALRDDFGLALEES
jgi:hypothetical protein